MGKCAFCYSNTHMLNSKKIMDGTICNSCLKTIPNCISIDRYDSDELQKIQKYASNPLFEKFEATSKLGCLLLDETNGLFAIESKQNVFKLTDLKKYSIHSSKNKVDKNSNKVYVDIEFTCSLNPIDLDIRKIIKQNIKCEIFLKGDSYYHRYPVEVSLFNDMFTAAIKNQIRDVLPLLTAYQNVTNQAKLIAESMLMVDDNYTLSELKTQRNRLLNIYHPDNGGDAVYCERINTSYKYLVEHYQPPKPSKETALNETIQV